MKKIELLAPAGDAEKLKTALYFGADAVYVGGKDLNLRAYACGFDEKELQEAVKYTHNLGKKIYVTVNIFARNYDIEKAADYVVFLENIGVDGVIVSDAGILTVAGEKLKNMPVFLSTQASALNYAAVNFWKNAGVKRVILARELSLKEIKEIHDKVPDIELETFIHGAMCISYSGRCLLSDYRAGRSSNRGECVQACRWSYEIREKGSNGAFMDMEQDERGTYILNSKDLCLCDYISELAEAGVSSFKIEGRMKSEYYLATVVNAYRRALDSYYKTGAEYKNNDYISELEKTAHREFTTAYLLDEYERTENFDDSQSEGTHKFIAKVLSYDNEKKCAVVEMRNRFAVGDQLEVLSPSSSFNKIIKVESMTDDAGNNVTDAKIVQQHLKIFTEVSLNRGDILRKKFYNNSRVTI